MSGPRQVLQMSFLFACVSDGLGVDADPSATASVRDEEEAAEEQKDDGKLGFCEIQWQQEAQYDARKFMKKNFKRLDDPATAKLNLSITKIDEEKDDDRVEIIPLSSPMKVRSPLGYRSSYNVPDENPNNLNVAPKIAPVHLSAANIKAISQPVLQPPRPETSSHENLRKTSLLSLKSLSVSLRMLKHRARSDSLDTIEGSPLETIDETSRKSIFKMDLFERNLKKFVTKSNEDAFQSYTEYNQQQQNARTRPRTSFKNQKIYDRRSSMSDVQESNQNIKSLHHHSGISTSSSNIKHDTKQEAKRSKDERKAQKAADKTAEMLKEVRKRNMESSKRMSNPAARRISTAY